MDIYVANAGDNGNDGTEGSPVETIGEAFSRLTTDDRILLNRGDTFVGQNISPDTPNLQVLAYGVGDRPLVTGIMDLRFSMGEVSIEGIHVDIQQAFSRAVRFRNAVNVGINDCIIERSANHLVDIQGDCQRSIIANSILRKAIHQDSEPEVDVGEITDAHGITYAALPAGSVHDVIDCDLHTFTGDCIQMDPGRNSNGITINIVGTKLHADDLDEAFGNWFAGQRPGEDAIDTKNDGQLGDPIFLNIGPGTEVYGWNFGEMNSGITNPTGFNLKESVVVDIDGMIMHNCFNALRIRDHNPRGRCIVTCRNSIFYDNNRNIRIEDQATGSTFDHNCFDEPFDQGGGSPPFHIQWAQVDQPNRDTHVFRNNWWHGIAPDDVDRDDGNKDDRDGITDNDFVDRPGHNYRHAGSYGLVDVGISMQDILHHDFDQRSRPINGIWDVGAFEDPTAGGALLFDLHRNDLKHRATAVAEVPLPPSLPRGPEASPDRDFDGSCGAPWTCFGDVIVGGGAANFAAGGALVIDLPIGSTGVPGYARPYVVRVDVNDGSGYELNFEWGDSIHQINLGLGVFSFLLTPTGANTVFSMTNESGSLSLNSVSIREFLVTPVTPSETEGFLPDPLFLTACGGGEWNCESGAELPQDPGQESYFVSTQVSQGTTNLNSANQNIPIIEDDEWIAIGYYVPNAAFGPTGLQVQIGNGGAPALPGRDTPGEHGVSYPTVGNNQAFRFRQGHSGDGSDNRLAWCQLWKFDSVIGRFLNDLFNPRGRHIADQYQQWLATADPGGELPDLPTGPELGPDPDIEGSCGVEWNCSQDVSISDGAIIMGPTGDLFFQANVPPAGINRPHVVEISVSGNFDLNIQWGGDGSRTQREGLYRILLTPIATSPAFRVQAVGDSVEAVITRLSVKELLVDSGAPGSQTMERLVSDAVMENPGIWNIGVDVTHNPEGFFDLAGDAQPSGSSSLTSQGWGVPIPDFPEDHPFVVYGYIRTQRNGACQVMVHTGPEIPVPTVTGQHFSVIATSGNSGNNLRLRAPNGQGFEVSWVQVTDANSALGRAMRDLFQDVDFPSATQDMESQFLLSGGAPLGNNNDMWFEYLGARGYEGALSDRMRRFWATKSGIIIPGEDLPGRWLIGTNDGFLRGYRIPGHPVNSFGLINPNTVDGILISQLTVLISSDNVVLDMGPNGGEQIPGVNSVSIAVGGWDNESPFVIPWDEPTDRYQGTIAGFGDYLVDIVGNLVGYDIVPVTVINEVDMVALNDWLVSEGWASVLTNPDLITVQGQTITRVQAENCDITHLTPTPLEVDTRQELQRQGFCP